MTTRAPDAFREECNGFNIDRDACSGNYRPAGPAADDAAHGDAGVANFRRWLVRHPHHLSDGLDRPPPRTNHRSLEEISRGVPRGGEVEANRPV
jgi:hypothetical protein